MSDETAAHFASTIPTQEKSAGRSVTLSITLHSNGSIDFSLPYGNKILGYGLLECARAQLDKFYLIQEAKDAQPAHGGLLGVLNGRRR